MSRAGRPTAVAGVAGPAEAGGAARAAAKTSGATAAATTAGAQRRRPGGTNKPPALPRPKRAPGAPRAPPPTPKPPRPPPAPPPTRPPPPRTRRPRPARGAAPPQQRLECPTVRDAGAAVTACAPEVASVMGPLPARAASSAIRIDHRKLSFRGWSHRDVSVAAYLPTQVVVGLNMPANCRRTA